MAVSDTFALLSAVHSLVRDLRCALHPLPERLAVLLLIISVLILLLDRTRSADFLSRRSTQNSYYKCL
jgi:hypothetical protein